MNQFLNVTIQDILHNQYSVQVDEMKKFSIDIPREDTVLSLEGSYLEEEFILGRENDKKPSYLLFF